jgi:hypothetical protein
MRWAAAFAACSLILIAGCGGSSSSSGSSQGPGPQAPKANPGGPYTGTAGVAVTFNGAASSDPQSQALTFLWNFGDGATGTGVNPTHTYPQVTGQTSTIYSVSLTVQNTSGLSNQATTTATIQDLTPLADASITGTVETGKKPISGAHVYLFAAGNTGYGLPSVSLLSATETGTSDSTGAYVATNAFGVFSISGDYTCTAGQQLYVYASGGDSGSGQNSAATLLAAIGPCPSSSSPGISVWVNEVSTVATAFSLAGFAIDPTHISSSGTALAQTGIANAFANVTNLETLSTGVALAATPNGNGVVPQAEINTLANALEACVDPSNSVSNPCDMLFSNAYSGGLSGTEPTNTATAAINIAHNPAINVNSVYQIPINTPAYTPALSRAPNDFTLGLTFAEGTVSDAGSVAVDAAGNAWMVDPQRNSVLELSNLGAILSGAGGYTSGGLNNSGKIAIDQSGNVWITNLGGGITELTKSGAPVSGSLGYTGGGLNQPVAIAIDGRGNAWVEDTGGLTIVELSSTGSPLSGSGGFTSIGGTDSSIAIDGAGGVWLPNMFGGVTKMSSSGAVLSGANGYRGAGILNPLTVAIDNFGNAWVTNSNASISVLSNTGSAVSGGNGDTAASITNPSAIAVDGSGNVWVLNMAPASVTEFSNPGSVLSGPSGYMGGNMINPASLAIDGSGDIWVTNPGSCTGTTCNSNSLRSGGTVTELMGVASPVITPLAAGLPATPTANGSSSLGTLP